MNTRSIQFRLILWYSCLVVLVASAFGAYTYYGVRTRLYADIEHTLTRRAHQIATNLLPKRMDSADLTASIRSLYSPEVNNRFIRILREDHSIFYISGPSQDGRFNPAEIRIQDGNIPPLRIDSPYSGSEMLITATEAQANGHTYIIEMGAPTNEIEQTLHSLLITLLYGLLAIIAIISTGGYILVRRALQPVDHIAATANEITFGNLSNRLPIATTGDAIEHLSITLNKMLDRLENAYEQAIRFSADASHELRTPLTIMRGELESLARVPEMQRFLQERVGIVLEETERLCRITENLFTISRLDAGEVRMEYKPCDLAALSASTAEQMALMAEEKHITLHVDTRAPVQVLGDAGRLKQVVVNLLDNAFKYAQANGNVWMSVTSANAMAKLEVRDDGIGISAAALPYVFERFYRADKARSRDEGAGLGLSIVKSICEAHGGTVEVKSAINKGTLCRVSLPLIKAES